MNYYYICPECAERSYKKDWGPELIFENKKGEVKIMYKNKYDDDVIRFYQRDKVDKIPAELFDIYYKWGELADKVGDIGSCVLGAGFLFKYKKKWYFLTPNTRHQGSVSWETNKDEIMEMLQNLGVTDLRYEWGIMD